MRAAIIVIAMAVGIASPLAAQDTPRLLKRPAVAAPTEPAAPSTQAPAPTGAPLAEKRQDALGNLALCNADRDCPTGNCVDGVCCNEKCAGNCRSCALPGHLGTCMDVPDGQDPRRACQIAIGGHPSCNGACYAGQCAVPDLGAPCGLCAACDGNGRCTVTPADDTRCGSIDCSKLNSACRTYLDLEVARCASLGACKTPNDSATCTLFANHRNWRDSQGVVRECKDGH
jgi:hypothetical protein